MTSWPFGALKPMGYGAILADPPWSYKMYSGKGYKKAPEGQYDTMSDGDILNLPVGDLAQRDCLLFLWAVWPKLPLAHECVKRWGFTHVTGGVWMKRTASLKLRWGPGYVLRSVCEPFIIARNGDPQARVTDQPNAIGDVGPDDLMTDPIIINALAREHSRKPPEARTIVEKMTPAAFRCELFAREEWPGNDVWGNETAKFFRET